MGGGWWTPRAISAHVTLALCEPGFAALAWWQVDRALSGNSLSWVYVFEWPFFGVYAVFLWWRIVHDQPLVPERLRGVVAERGAEGAARETDEPVMTSGEEAVDQRAAERAAVARAREQDEERELAAYNRYLQALRAEDRPKRW